MARRLAISFLLVGLCSLGSLARADLILGNLPATSDTTLSAGLTNLRLKGIRFTMGSESLQVTDLTLRLGNFNVDGEVIAQIRDFTGSTVTPGTNVLLNFIAPSNGGAAIQEYLFTPAANFTLQANTTYWLFVGGIAGGTFDWRATTSTIADPYTGLATYGSGSFTSNGGTSWANSTSRNYFALNGVSAIPEPGCLLGLALLAGCALATGRRRVARW